MAKNIPGAIFTNKKGIIYVLLHGPKGNLRPYTLGALKKAAKTRNPWIIVVAILIVVTATARYWIWKRTKKNRLTRSS